VSADTDWKISSQFEAILSSIAEGVTVQDLSGRVVYANEAAAQSCGYPSAEALLAAPIGEAADKFEVLDASGAPVAVERLPGRRVIEGELAPELMVCLRDRQSGQEHWRIVKARPVHDQDGKLRGAVSIFYDITERKLAEERQAFLAVASDMLAASLDYCTTLERVVHLGVPRLADWCTVHLLDTDGNLFPLAIAHADPQKVELAWELQRRYPPRKDDPEGLPKIVRTGRPELYSDIPEFVLEAIAQDAEHLRLLRSTGLKSGMSVPLIARGKILGALTFASAESGRRYTAEHLAIAGELAHRAAIAIDNAVSYKHAQEALRSRDDFLAVVSHDMKNPLSAILLNVNQVLKRIKVESPSPRVVNQLSAVRHAAERINRLISDLLDSAGLDSGQMVIEPQPELVTALTSAALEIMQPIAMENSIRLEAPVPPSLEQRNLEVACDRERILQVFSNLIGNAIKFAPEGSTIRLWTEIAGDAQAKPNPTMVRFAVSDNGPGIPSDQLEHIFERYWQGDRAIHRGVGLGLYIAKRLIEAHQGQLWCESVVHKGTTFYFTLPVAHGAL
jgi:signal transduction histidine kinase